jgi:hypothetical protein
MKKESQRGAAILEFSFIMLVLIPLLVGTAEIGINMVNGLQTVQVARDAGHMFARGVDFTQPGNRQILASLGSAVGMSTSTGAGMGTALVILSKIKYIDKAACVAYGLPMDAGGNPIGCTNLGNWVFEERILIGNTSMRTSNFGSPLASGPNSVSISANGTISQSDQTINSGDRATFSGINPYQVVSGTVTGLPSGQSLYIAEAAAQGFRMNVFTNNATSYSFGIF